MVTLEGSIRLAAPPERVWEAHADVERMHEWQRGVHGSELLTPGPLGVGSRFQETFDWFGQSVSASCEVAEATWPRRLAWQSVSRGPVSDVGEFVLEPAGEGTSLGYASVMRTHGLWRLLEPLLRLEVKRETTRELDALKAFVEGRATADAPRSAEVGTVPR
jgi:uncharacterized protein YndB with AHSA1/START domain